MREMRVEGKWSLGGEGKRGLGLKEGRGEGEWRRWLGRTVEVTRGGGK